MSGLIPRERAEAFAVTLSSAIADADESEFMWEAAARTAGLDGFDVRVVNREKLRFLVGQEWVVYMDDDWVVREWLHEDDPDFESATELLALEEQDLDEELDL